MLNHAIPNSEFLCSCMVGHNYSQNPLIPWIKINSLQVHSGYILVYIILEISIPNPKY